MTARKRFVLVAGTTGFIGRRTVRALTAAGHVVVDLPRADVAALLAEAANPDDAAARAAVHTIASAFAGEIDVLVWAAGARAPDLAANRAIHVAAPVAALRSLGIPRIVYLSTGEVYGDAPLPYREDGPALGTSDYARAKLEGERAVGETARSNMRAGLGSRATAADLASAATILRLALVYGPDQTPRMLIPRLVAALRAGQHMPLTHGEQTRDLVFVDDVAAAIVAAVEAPATLDADGVDADGGHQVFNIASGVETRIKDVCLGIARALGADPVLLGFGETALRPDEAHRYVMDVARAAERLGWRATTSLADGFARLSGFAK